MRGILLAGGRGTRLYPATLVNSKQLLPIYDKPMIYYSLSVLMLAGIREILLISTPQDLERFQTLFQDGSHLGLRISYAIQPRPDGIAQALLIGANFIGAQSVALVLGDSLFYGHGLSDLLAPCRNLQRGGILFAYAVKDPERYGVVFFDAQGRATQILEKPTSPSSCFAVTGLYFYDNDVLQIARELTPSSRGELEITDVNMAYLRRGELTVQLLGRGYAWLDTGTHDALYSASVYVQTIQQRQGVKIACIEEIAYRMGFIDEEQVLRLAHQCDSDEYREYLQRSVQMPELACVPPI